jgi:hypothetical protein
LSGYGRNTVERATDSHKEGLFMRFEGQHVIPVGSDIVGGGAESDQPEYG